MGVVPEEQKPLDLEALRARNEERRVHDTDDDPSYVDGYRGYVNGKRDDDYDREHAVYFESAITDIDALLAEVERLGAELAHEQRVTLAYRSDGDVLRAEVERLCGVISEQQDRNLQFSYKAYPPNHSGE